MLVENASKYMIDSEPYLGSFTQTNRLPLGEYFMKKMTETINGSNRNLTMENCFSSVPLAIYRVTKEPYKLTLV